MIIAGAGGAAHLPGMVAALTSLPGQQEYRSVLNIFILHLTQSNVIQPNLSVIGVPVKSSNLNGEDSLLSIVQMPRGIPVATVAIGMWLSLESNTYIHTFIHTCI